MIFDSNSENDVKKHKKYKNQTIFMQVFDFTLP